jgi:protein involved in polysaccharide export with SLBB domain
MRKDWPWVCLLGTVSVLTGCTTGPGGRGGLFPSPAHRMLETTRAVRQSTVSALPRELDKRTAPPFVVEPGDVLLVQPADLDSPVRLPGDQPVLPDGTIQLGKYGRPQVAGRTVEEIESLVQSLVATRTPNAGTITVRLVTRQSKVFYVLGEVNAPGAFTLSGRETVLDAILLAGGLTDRASHANIVLSRPTAPCSPRIVLPICYDEIVQLGDTSTNYQINAGDRIFVAGKTLCEDLSLGRTKPCPPCGQAHGATPLPPEPCKAGGCCDGGPRP